MSETKSTSCAPGHKALRDTPTEASTPKNRLRAALAADCDIDRHQPVPMAPYDASRTDTREARFTTAELAKICATVTGERYERLLFSGASIHHPSEKRPLLERLADAIGRRVTTHDRLTRELLEALCRERGLDPEAITEGDR